ncbi:MAG: amino acid adenylation domain-containing protein [Cyanobacteria bacterium P01_A01_bin.84]
MNKKQIQDIYPLSPMQQGMLFHSLYAPNSGVYIIQVSFEIHGSLDIAAFEQAWKVTIDTYPILRTAFVWEKIEKPLQVVGREVKVPIVLIDWSSLEELRQNQQLEELLYNQRKQGFNLAKAPLMRLILIHKQPHCYQFIWIYHHLLLDGWSVPLVLKSVLNTYSVISKDKYSIKSLSESNINKPRPYKNYIAWLQQQNLYEAEQFWRKKLAGFSVPTPFRVDKRVEQSQKIYFNNRTNNQDNNKEQQIQLSQENTAKLQAIAKKHQLTLNTFIQGAFALMLSWYSGENDVVFGVTSSGRPSGLLNSEFMVGLFINTLPMRVNLDNKSLLPWLTQLQEQQLEIQQYEYTPLVEIQRWSDIPKGLPLFESLIVFENYPVEDNLKSTLEDLSIRNIQNKEQNNYPLGLYVTADSVIKLRILYDSDRFDDESILRMLGHLQVLLEGIVDALEYDTELILSELPLLTNSERQQLLFEWNNTKADYSDESIHQLFELQVELTPDKIAVIFESRQLTYKQLNQKANQLARYLQSIGVEKETRVGICVERSEKMVVGLLGILKAGGTYIPLDPSFPQERLKFMVEDSGIDFLVTDLVTDSEERLYKTSINDISTHHNSNNTINTIPLNAIWELITKQSDENLPPQTTPENLAYIIYTSGSTGVPKGVKISHKSLVNCLESMQKEPGISEDDVFFSVTTLSFDIAALELYLPLITGARLVIANRESILDGSQLIRNIENNQVTIMQATPVSWKLLLSAGRKVNQNNQQLKILCGGEALDISIAKELLKWGREVWNLYGPTEATIWSAVTQFKDVPCSISKNTFVPIGKPINNTQFYVLNNDLQAVPIGVPGELYIGGSGLASCYLNRPELTEKRFIKNPFDKLKVKSQKSKEEEEEFISPSAPSASPAPSASSTLYKTGDRVRYLPSGDLEYLGRTDYQVKLRGFRIELSEIEAILMQHPQVKEAVVVLHENRDDSQLIAYVISNSEVSQIQLKIQLRKFLESKLPFYMIPSQYINLEKFPLTPNLKIDRKALPITQETSRELEIAYVKSKTEIEQAIAYGGYYSVIAQIWGTVLQVDKIGIHDNFFDLGGHSLLMIKVHAQLCEKFDINLPLMEMFRHPTIHSLTGYFSNQGNEINSQADFHKNESREQQIRAGKDRIKQRLQRKKGK